MINDHGLRNYANLYSVNSSEVMLIAGIAETILRFMAYGPAAEPYQFTDSPFDMNRIPPQ
ncbi:MAG: hypothetical protein ACI9UA_003245, partial [Pseudoalteromonas tetraodonis]